MHFMESKPTKENPYPVQHMGYSHHINSPKRRSLKHLAVNMSCAEPEESAVKVNGSHMDVCDGGDWWSVAKAIAKEHSYCSRLTSDCATQTDSASFMSTHNLSNEDSKFYTGIGAPCFWQLLYALEALLPQQRITTLAVRDQLLLVLMRLRLGLVFRDLSRRFGISRNKAFKIFLLWMPMLAKFMRENVISWLPRDTLKRIRPQSFSKHYPHATCIVDCTEIFVRDPNYSKNLSQACRTYKQVSTHKVLYCIAPNGYVMFVSKLFGVEVSDTFIVKNSGFIDRLIPGDQLLAGHGFPDTDVLPPGVTLARPAFTQECKQFSKHGVTQTARITNGQIHVERALNRLKGFKVLSNVIPCTVKNVDDIVSICAGLCNLQP